MKEQQANGEDISLKDELKSDKHLPNKTNRFGCSEGHKLVRDNNIEDYSCSY